MGLSSTTAVAVESLVLDELHNLIGISIDQGSSAEVCTGWSDLHNLEHAVGRQLTFNRVCTLHKQLGSL